MQMSGRHAVFFWSPLCSSVSAQIFYPVSSSCARAEFLLFFLSLSGRFTSAAAPAILLFFFAQSLSVNSSCAHIFFFDRSQPHSTVVRAAFCFCVRSLSASFDSLRSNFFVTGRCVTRAARKIFLLLPCRSVRAAGCAQNIFFPVMLKCRARRTFLLRSFVFFCRPVSSAQTLCFDFFCGAWNLCSSLFSESCVRNLNFWRLPSAVSGSLTTLVRTS
jgi:hypothetical protein